MSPAEGLELIERNDAGIITTTYIETAAGEGVSRVDAVVRPTRLTFTMCRPLTTTASESKQEPCTPAARRLLTSWLPA